MLKPRTLGWDCSVSGIMCSYCCLRKLSFSRARDSAKHKILRQFAIIFQCSPCKMLGYVFIQCSTCILLGCVFIMAKVSLSRVGTQSEGKEPWYRYFRSWIRLTISWTETLSILDNFSDNTKLVNCNRRHSFSQYNEFRNVF